MHIVKSVPLAFLLAIPLTAGRSDAAGSIPNPPHLHAMPCPANIQPDRIRVSWTFDTADGLHQHGSKTILATKTVSHFYHHICGEQLVKYDRPLVRSCPNVTTSAFYHLNFLRQRQSLLRLTEESQGCETLYVDKRPDLGSAFTLLLPKGIPQPPMPAPD